MRLKEHSVYLFECDGARSITHGLKEGVFRECAVCEGDLVDLGVGVHELVRRLQGWISIVPVAGNPHVLGGGRPPV